MNGMRQVRATRPTVSNGDMNGIWYEWNHEGQHEGMEGKRCASTSNARRRPTKKRRAKRRRAQRFTPLEKPCLAGLAVAIVLVLCLSRLPPAVTPLSSSPKQVFQFCCPFRKKKKYMSAEYRKEGTENGKPKCLQAC